MSRAGVKKYSVISEKRGVILRSLVHILNPENVLEIGSGFGSTLKIILTAVKNKKLKIITVDWNEERVKRLKRKIKSKRIKFIYADAFVFLENLIYEKKSGFFDFILIDAQKKDYVNLLNYARRLLKKGGIVFLDDAFYYDYKKYGKIKKESYINMKRKIKGFNISLIPEETGVIIGEKL